MGRGRPQKYDYSSPQTFATGRGRKSLAQHIRWLKRTLEIGIDKHQRRYICFVCGTLFRKENVNLYTQRKYRKDGLRNSENYSYFMNTTSTYPHLQVNLWEEAGEGEVFIYVCKKWCERKQRQALRQGRVPICPSLQTLRPLGLVPVAVRQVDGFEAGALSLVDRTVNFGGGIGRGYYFALRGDFRSDEDLAGSVGTVVGNMQWDNEKREKVRVGSRALIADGKHSGVRRNFLVAERSKYDIGMRVLPREARLSAPIEGRGPETPISGHAIPRSERIRRAQMRSRDAMELRAGVVYPRRHGTPTPVYWKDDVEVMLFPQLYMNGIGGYEWTSSRGCTWEEHVEKRVWNVNPMFRHSELFLAFMFDFGEKLEMHRSATRSFVPDAVREGDAEAYCYMSESSARGFENMCKRELLRGRWGLAAVSDGVGIPNVFQTETMNEGDMAELVKASYQLWPGAPQVVDIVTTAVLYKYRQIVIMEILLPRTGVGSLIYGSIRLEIQSGRSYRLHAHNMLRMSATDDALLKCVSASMSSLAPEARARHEPVARHRCLSYKCRNDICTYGYPVLEAAERTHRVAELETDTEEEDKSRVVYKREVGDGVVERDEYCTPFCVELASTRVCHGAFLVCTNEIATGYTGKYVFKRSGV